MNYMDATTKFLSVTVGDGARGREKKYYDFYHSQGILLGLKRRFGGVSYKMQKSNMNGNNATAKNKRSDPTTPAPRRRVLILQANGKKKWAFED